MTTTLAPPLLRQHLVDVAVELRAHPDARAYLVEQLADLGGPGERLTYAVLYAALERPGMTHHVLTALDAVGSYAEAGGDRSLHEHDTRCGFALGHPDCPECEQHWQNLLDDALDHLLGTPHEPGVLTAQAVADLTLAAA